MSVAATALGVAAMYAIPARAAGSVSVDFKDPSSYADIGWSTVQRDENLRLLGDHMLGWRALLPDGRHLQIEVLDIDLAGDTNRWWHHPGIRVLTGRVDAPRMRLRWTLKAADQVLGSGEARLIDHGYLDRTTRLRGDGSLSYDKRMLDDWLRQRVLDGSPPR